MFKVSEIIDENTTITNISAATDALDKRTDSRILIFLFETSVIFET